MAFDRFRNQFVLGPAPASTLPDGRIVSVSEHLCLTVHRDLNVTVVQGEHGRLALVGFVLDPRRPDASDEDILETLMPALCPPDPATPLLEDDFSPVRALGGRWALVIERTASAREAAVIHDAAGLRQVFHSSGTTDEADAPTWCASRAGLIARELGRPEDDDARDFAETYAALEDEFWWPGTSSPFVGIARLLPNHVLPLDGARPRRFWPRAPLASSTPEEALEVLPGLLDGTLRAAAKRFDLVLGMTAGWDSRLALAASRSVTDRVRGVTVRQAGMEDDDMDLVVSAELLGKVGVAHRVVESSSVEGEDREALVEDFLANTDYPHEKWAGDVIALADAFPERPLAVSGGFAEAARNFYGTESDAGEGPIDAAYLLRACYMPAHPFAVRHVEAWLAGVPTDLGYSVLDLFYWELRTGSWLAMCQGEFDPAWGDIVSPYDNRELMMHFLEVDKRYRKGPWYLLHRRLIDRLWPGLMDVPINPSDAPTGWLQRGRSWLKAFASFHASDSLKEKLKRR